MGSCVALILAKFWIQIGQKLAEKKTAKVGCQNFEFHKI